MIKLGIGYRGVTCIREVQGEDTFGVCPSVAVVVEVVPRARDIVARSIGHIAAALVHLPVELQARGRATDGSHTVGTDVLLRQGGAPYTELIDAAAHWGRRAAELQALEVVGEVGRGDGFRTNEVAVTIELHRTAAERNGVVMPLIGDVEGSVGRYAT